MKNKLLLFATFVLVSLGAFASTGTLKFYRYYNSYGNSFTFVERGVTFAVFQNGEFDFYINQRNGVNFGYRSRGVNITFNSGYNYDTFVQYDDSSAVCLILHQIVGVRQVIILSRMNDVLNWKIISQTGV